MARNQYAAVINPKAATSVKKMTKKTIFVRSEQMRKTTQIKPIARVMKPKLALNPCVVNPSAPDVAFAGAYDEKAAKEGFRVAPKVNQKEEKVRKTTEGKVLPRTHSRRPPTNMRRPPKKKYEPMPAAPLPPAPLQPIKSQARGVNEMRNPTIAIGVGLPKVLRRSPLTLFCGDRYSFSNSSGDIEIDPAVFILLSASSRLTWGAMYSSSG